MVEAVGAAEERGPYAGATVCTFCPRCNNFWLGDRTKDPTVPAKCVRCNVKHVVGPVHECPAGCGYLLPVEVEEHGRSRPHARQLDHSLYAVDFPNE